MRSRGSSFDPEGVSRVMNRRNGRGEYVAEMLVEPELSSQLSGLGYEERTCQCYALKFPKLQVVCKGLERIQR